MKQRKRKGVVFVISGPSGSGKTTLIKRLLKNNKVKKNLVKIITYTTRPPRGKEKQGLDYIFVDKKEFRERIRKRKFLEWQKVLGEYYGTPKEPVEENVLAGRDVLLCIDVKGAKFLQKKRGLYSVYIFVLPSDKGWLDALKLRLKKRSSDSFSQIKERLALAVEEVTYARYYDYIIVNKDINEAIIELAGIILLERKRAR